MKEQAIKPRECVFKKNADNLIAVGYKQWRKKRKSPKLTDEEQEDKVRKIDESRNLKASKEMLSGKKTKNSC